MSDLIDLKHENVLAPLDAPQKIKLNLGSSRMRAIYERKVGKEWVHTTPLPADPASRALYFSKGFRAPRANGSPEGVEVTKVADGLIKCPLCEFVTQSVFGLQSHLRKHKNKSKKEEN